MKFRDPLEIREWAEDPRLKGFEDAFFEEGGVLNAKVSVVGNIWVAERLGG